MLLAARVSSLRESETEKRTRMFFFFFLGSGGSGFFSDRGSDPLFISPSLKFQTQNLFYITFWPQNSKKITNPSHKPS